MKKNILLIALVCLMSGCIFKGPDDLSKKKPEFEVSAIELYNEFETDEDASNTKYLDKIILVSGEVAEISEKSILVGEGMTLVNCALAENEMSKLSNVKIGQTIKIKGACTGFNMLDVGLTKCVITE